ncbi:MFS transporter [Amycolatopsis sp. NEAU-NG30]|uniref:MFS transporter n=1 Tax=Amycolatopsis melonis TaxID=3156488 RepID=A0ABV0LSZ3_9PSEU
MSTAGSGRCIAALALSAGALADRYGRKRMFVTGVVLFTAGSAVCALAPDAVVLVIGRFVQGTGAAITVPGTLSLIAQGFPEQGQRARAIGVWSMVAGLAAIAGPVLGGALVDAFGWSSIFLINLPIGLVAVVVAVRSVTESADPDHASLDPAGQVLCVAWLGLLLYGLINAGTAGWSGAGTVLPLAGFLVVEVRQDRPMLPVRLFRHPPFAGANTASFLLGFSVLSALFFLPLYLQQVQGVSAAGPGGRGRACR